MQKILDEATDRMEAAVVRRSPPAGCPAKSLEAVDHPPHYRSASGHEAIDVIEAWGLGFCLGNVVKYIFRAGIKAPSPLEDLKKASWYLTREISRLEAQCKSKA